ncbi:hypothetical protein [Clostridium cylindrosporum]|uniref:Uncharacterized protein n=1 Tax=Clostridium cylindrosporum DSM 605 TaxID=1121307 RepID=A0A0J8DA09_CLOCY|nr:hypothetical protein [Clostridium cylindrosporum]KMT22682.1 hypothetical protein CLCY_11c00160 [Clostridium cylindrosporum DSM 605]
MITIGVFGSKEKRSLIKLLFNYLIERGKRVVVIEQVDSTSFNRYKENVDFLIFDINSADIKGSIYEKIRFDIVLEGLLDSNDSSISVLQSSVLSIRDNGYFIFNSDYTDKINFKCNNLYPITYGLNGKCSVTASSVNDIERLEFSYCLQRAILTIDKDVIEPFESPIKVKGEIVDLNGYLAVLTCLLVLGYKF